ncbi:hypothetical protein [Acidithiobacillus sp.]|jgi:hypothetical protein|uniref:hypothetical protein n=1 Tax=Acidithiobacillus sp. TaxID=1872118 RepID=UPI003567AC93
MAKKATSGKAKKQKYSNKMSKNQIKHLEFMSDCLEQGPKGKGSGPARQKHMDKCNKEWKASK